MPTIPAAFALPLLLFVVSAASLGAQERRSAAPGGPLPYDRTQETTIRGTFLRSYTIPIGQGREMQVVAVQTDQAERQLILAPPDFVKSAAFTFTAGARCEATGIEGLQINGQAAMMTRFVTAGGKTLTVRDETGRPLWP